MAFEVLQNLNTASAFEHNEDPNIIKINYQTGAQFEGMIVDYQRVGKGTFTWPNGSKYEGDYFENLRHGKGTQVWSDGSFYTGDFLSDLRHGQGCMQWSNGETYEGTFFKDRRHGKGTYRWADNSSYSGMFYMDRKEGLGTFYFSNGNKFEGLYLEDEREGPGVATSKDGKQDVGLWRGEKLIKLCSAIKGAFTILSHPEFEFKSEEHIIEIIMNDGNQYLAPIESILNPPPVLDYPPKTDLTKRLTEIYSVTLHHQSLAIDRQSFDREYFKDLPDNAMIPVRIVAWNLTPDMVDLQKHSLKHLFRKMEIDIDIDAVSKLNRSGFKETDLLEQQSEEFIIAAEDGNVEKVETLLISGKVHPDVSDCHGHTALIGATVNRHINIINILLNYGANVNKLNDEGCSALSVAAVFYFPFKGFVYNIADGNKEPKQETMDIDSIKDSQHSNILANNKERRSSKTNQITRKKSGFIDSEFNTTSMLDMKPHTDKDIEARSFNEENISVFEYIIDDESNNLKTEDSDSAYGDDKEIVEDFEKEAEEDDPEDFESIQSLRNYRIEVTDRMIERCATQLSQNELVVGRETSGVSQIGKARLRAVEIFNRERMKETLNLLIKRGADPNISFVPLPVLFMAIKSADVEIVRLLLLKGANPNSRLSTEKGGLYPLHIACALPGEEGVKITELLLNALADPNAKAEEDDSFLNHFLEDEWSKDVIPEDTKVLLGGRTALQIACARDDNYKNVSSVVRLLLEHKADTSLMCNGFSPLALAITCGNDLAVDELLTFGADPSLPLTHGVGSALCVAVSTQYEHQRTLQGRLQLIDKLVKAGANVLAPIPIGPKRILGTSIDYAYYMFNQDHRIAHIPYHALTHAERDTYNSRRKLLAHVGDIVRIKAVEREKRRNMEEKKQEMRSQSPSTNFLYIGAGAKLPSGMKSKSASKMGQGQVKFESSNKDVEVKTASSEERSGVIFEELVDKAQLKRSTWEKTKPLIRKPLFKYCYECGRSVGVRLTACTRCKEVYYCSKACKLKAWNARHKDECLRIGGRSRSPSPKIRAGSPIAATMANRGKNLTGFQQNQVQIKGFGSADKQSKLGLGYDDKQRRLGLGCDDKQRKLGLGCDDKQRRLGFGSADKQRKPFRTGSPPNYEYVYIDNYSHN